MPTITKLNKLTIHFQRDTDNSSRDDVLTVMQADDSWVMVKYHDKDANVKNVSFMKETGFMSYMEGLFSLMRYDSSPYQNVQISAPCHPQILISSADLSNDDCINSIGNVLSSCWRIWYPFTAKTADADEDDDVEMEEDEDEGGEDTHYFHGCHCNQS